MRVLPVLIVLLAAATPALAQQTARKVEHFPAAGIRQALAPADTARGGLSSTVLADHGAYNYVVARRVESGEAEIHRDFDDVMFIQEGAATMLHGGTVQGGRETGPGERRGGTIVGGTPQPVAAGDIIVIPAGVPHQFQLAPGQRIIYAVVKPNAHAVVHP